MRTLLSQLATAKRSDFVENSRSEILSSGGEEIAISAAISPRPPPVAVDPVEADPEAFVK